MTAIQIANQIPNSIDTLEKLAAWSGLALSYLNPTQMAVEGVGINERVAQSGIFYVAADNKYRMLIRLSLEISPDHQFGAAKQWAYIQALTNTALPAGFSS